MDNEYNATMSKRLRHILRELDDEIGSVMRMFSESPDAATRQHYAGVHLGLRIAVEVVEEQLEVWREARAARAELPSRLQVREQPSVN